MPSVDSPTTNPEFVRRVGIAWRTLPKLCLIAVFKGYRLFISPLFPPVCRFVPSCSQYAIEAVEKHGVVRGGGMAIWRILRCHPFSRGGYDPVR